MPEDIKPIEPGMIEVDQPAIAKGEVKFMGKHGFGNPTPRIVKAWTEGIVYFCAGLIGIVGGSDLFTGRQSKAICLVLAIVVLACGAIQKSTGVKPIHE